MRIIGTFEPVGGDNNRHKIDSDGNTAFVALFFCSKMFTSSKTLVPTD